MDLLVEHEDVDHAPATPELVLAARRTASDGGRRCAASTRRGDGATADENIEQYFGADLGREVKNVARKGGQVGDACHFGGGLRKEWGLALQSAAGCFGIEMVLC